MLGVSGRAVVFAFCVALDVVAGGRGAQAQTEAGVDPLAAARSLFAEALRDEEAGHFATALPKFQRVRDVRDTAPVEYRIGSCEEGLGQSAQAYGAYLQAAALGQDEVESAEVVRAAAERLRALEKHVARLMLVLSPRAPADAEVRVDDATIPAAALRKPIALEPGTHVVTGSANSATPFRSVVALPEGAQASLTISLEPRSPSDPGEARSSAPTRRVAGWIAIGGGGALLASSGVLFLARHGDISALNRACPGGACPATADAADLQSTRQRALVEGPVALALGVAGVVAVGLGGWLVLGAPAASSSSRGSGTRLLPLFSPGAAGVTIAGAFR